MKSQATLLAGILLCSTPGIYAFDKGGGHDRGPSNIVYVNSNNPLPGKNAVLAYRRDPATGNLTEIPGSPFLTGGAGYYNVDERLGPDDHDQEIAVSEDGHFLFAVNQGSGTVAGFAIQQNDGSLRALHGSPFPSGGVQPASLGVSGSFLIVANRGDQDPGGTGGSNAPNYSVFVIHPSGTLLAFNGNTLGLIPGSSPTQALVSSDGKLMFDTHVFEAPAVIPGLPPFIPSFASVLHSYQISPGGQLTAAGVVGTPPGLPPFILGLAKHPTEKVVYAGYVVAGAIAAYTYDDAGNMAFAGLAFGGGAGPCWIAVTPDGKYAYTADAITDQIDVFSLADPLHPSLAQTVDLKGPKVLTGDPLAVFTTTPFQMKISPDGQFLYVVNHETTLDNSYPDGNQVHWLKIAGDGTLTESAASPLVLPLSEEPANGHPLGICVF